MRHFVASKEVNGKQTFEIKFKAKKGKEQQETRKEESRQMCSFFDSC